MPTLVQKIYRIRIITIPNLIKGGFLPDFKVICNGHVFYEYVKQEKDNKFLRGISYYDFFINSTELLVFNDIKIQFYNAKKKCFHFSFHTSFIDSGGYLFLNKGMIDKASGDKLNIHYDKNFSVKVFMTNIEEYELVKKALKPDSTSVRQKKKHKERKNKSKERKKLKEKLKKDPSAVNADQSFTSFEEEDED
mmetsp:Transcript_23511/g.32026  ORF Transcript_23511/g.32026 Transcript_23511/m.32026 type:complete len:193 (+) Transcript_23511:368-946(+)